MGDVFAPPNSASRRQPPTLQPCPPSTFHVSVDAPLGHCIALLPALAAGCSRVLDREAELQQQGGARVTDDMLEFDTHRVLQEVTGSSARCLDNNSDA